MGSQVQQRAWPSSSRSAAVHECLPAAGAAPAACAERLRGGAGRGARQSSSRTSTRPGGCRCWFATTFRCDRRTIPQTKQQQQFRPSYSLHNAMVKPRYSMSSLTGMTLCDVHAVSSADTLTAT